MKPEHAMNLVTHELLHLDASSGCIKLSAMGSIITTVLDSPSIWAICELSSGDLFTLRRLQSCINAWVDDPEISLNLIFSSPVWEDVYTKFKYQLMNKKS